MTPLLARHEFAFHQLQWLSPFMAVGSDRLVPKLAAFAISLSKKQISDVKLHFKYQKYTRGWAVGWVRLGSPGTEPIEQYMPAIHRRDTRRLLARESGAPILRVREQTDLSV
jgi:hypothetical protein